jgi:hypothetical protein
MLHRMEYGGQADQRDNRSARNRYLAGKALGIQETAGQFARTYHGHPYGYQHHSQSQTEQQDVGKPLSQSSGPHRGQQDCYGRRARDQPTGDAQQEKLPIAHLFSLVRATGRVYLRCMFMAVRREPAVGHVIIRSMVMMMWLVVAVIMGMGVSMPGVVIMVVAVVVVMPRIVEERKIMLVVVMMVMKPRMRLEVMGPMIVIVSLAVGMVMNMVVVGMPGVMGVRMKVKRVLAAYASHQHPQAYHENQDTSHKP